MKTLATIGLALALGVAACGGAAEETAEQPAAATTMPAPTLTTRGVVTTTSSADVAEEPIVEETTAPTTTTTEPGGEEVAEPVISHPDADVAIAMTDLAARFEFAADDISLVSAEEVTWRDGSLGCPLPDMSYTQALVNGRRIVLAAGGAQYNYHSGAGREPFFCAKPAEPIGDGTDL
ncbi:MAG: hypothetical protein QNJ81_10050 [Acidimicrobiia bacterium]|nr:hypothetical protein [Acidimicrobiia bacterium]